MLCPAEAVGEVIKKGTVAGTRGEHRVSRQEHRKSGHLSWVGWGNTSQVNWGADAVCDSPFFQAGGFSDNGFGGSQHQIKPDHFPHWGQKSSGPLSSVTADIKLRPTETASNQAPRNV